jgi:hypothetical protein
MFKIFKIFFVDLEDKISPFIYLNVARNPFWYVFEDRWYATVLIRSLP